MQETDRAAWLRAIAVGFVVDATVAGMLSMLIYRVRRIDQRVVQVRDTLRAAAANTADAALIPQVADSVDAVLAEGLQHHLFLGRALGRVSR
ncbi:MAG: hypothetical protein J2P27_02200 [Actinobacteria bacterium]|nr:hypothetical protein [Actinomycetota bacterium]